MKKVKTKMNKPMLLGLSILEMYIKTRQSYAIWIQIAVLFILKLKMFMKTFRMVSKQDLLQEIKKLIGH